MSTDLAGRAHVVTGANRGIGYEVVKSLVTHGARRVYAGVRSPEKADPLVEEFGDGGVLPVLSLALQHH